MEGLLMSDMFREFPDSSLTAQMYLEKQMIQWAAVANLVAVCIGGVTESAWLSAFSGKHLRVGFREF
jgi:hypothetical protein